MAMDPFSQSADDRRYRRMMRAHAERAALARTCDALSFVAAMQIYSAQHDALVVVTRDQRGRAVASALPAGSLSHWLPTGDLPDPGAATRLGLRCREARVMEVARLLHGGGNRNEWDPEVGGAYPAFAWFQGVDDNGDTPTDRSWGILVRRYCASRGFAESMLRD